MSIDNFGVAEREYNPEEAYFNEVDGLYYCVDCRTPVEAYFAEKEKGKHPCMCKCRREEHERREKERKAREHADIIDKLRQDAFSGKRMYDWKFENSHADVKQIEVAKKYVDTWLEMEQRNQGLLFVGDVGRGKSFTAACIVSAVIELEVRAKMINIATIINDLQSLGGEERSNYIEKLCRYRLLVFDDLGAERGTEFAREQVYNVVNARWESGRPFIVTTNLTLQEMQNEEQMVLKRIYDRVLDVCRPVVFSRRKFQSKWSVKSVGNGAGIMEGYAMRCEVPVWEKSNLTLEEAAAYFGIGINRLRKLSDDERCPFVLWVGAKRLIKRKKLDEYTERMYSL